MFLKKLNILYFKNIEDIQFEFSKTITAFVGNNAVGKTNILDAIYYLSMTKSYFSSSDTQNIQHGKEFFVLSGKYEHEQAAFEVNCSFKKSEGKQITLNQKPYPKISDHIGKIPVVMIAPQDLNLITEYADTRRKFLDAFISKFDKEYLNALIQYHQILQHRNSIIKKGEIAFQQQDLLDVYNAQLSQYGEIILKKRHSFFEEIKNTLITVYQNLQDNQEHLELKYTSTIQNDFYKELQHSLPKDIRMGYTTTGPHRDDFEILINNYPAKNFASQGQQKTIVFAIKFLELMYLHQKTKITPILLIDDLFDRLDDGRLNKIRLQIKNSPVTQIFLTDNHYERVNKLFEQESIEIIQI